MAKATMATRNEIIERNRKVYKEASKAEKGRILDRVCSDTGLSRSRAKHSLGACPKAPPAHSTHRKRGGKPRYTDGFVHALAQMWMYMDFPCGRRLVAGMKDMLEALQRCHEMNVDDETVRQLMTVSASTADRLLRKHKEQLTLKGKSTTKPGTLLKNSIPIRLGTEWNDAVPGYVEMDLVAHCGSTTKGDYINTLDVTDICTGWTETEAVVNKAQKHVFKGLMNIQTRLPFPLRGIDSDNGSEFINDEMKRYCANHSLCFTRSRPNRKDDNCYVEQKNWHVVRRNIGYGRYEGSESVGVMNEYYARLRLYSNFFLPQMKLIRKERDGARIRKVYDTPKTPYQRVLASGHVDDGIKASLTEIFLRLNPVVLKREMLLMLKLLERQQVERHKLGEDGASNG